MFVTGGRDGRAILWDVRVGPRERAVHDVLHPYALMPHADHPLVQCSNGRKRRRTIEGPIPQQVGTATHHTQAVGVIYEAVTSHRC